jgi:hypothetical protein
MLRHALILYAAFAFAGAGVAKAQIPSSSGTAVQETPVNRRCDSVQRRVAKQERALATADESIANTRTAREGCSSKSACARYDQAIKSMEARRSRHDLRLAKFRTEAEKVCKPR